MHGPTRAAFALVVCCLVSGCSAFDPELLDDAGARDASLDAAGPDARVDASADGGMDAAAPDGGGDAGDSGPGDCEAGCAFANAVGTCVDGTCRMLCAEGFDDCDGLRDNGCERNVLAAGPCCAVDPLRSRRASCGCFGEPNPADLGTPCADGLCPQNDRCDGSGRCGDASACKPEADCAYAPFAGHGYFFCSTTQTWNDARSLCRAISGDPGDELSDLVRIDDRMENDFVAGRTLAPSWTLASDAAEEGRWSWNEGASAFWLGTSDGFALDGAFASWLDGEPDGGDMENCLAVLSSGRWQDRRCTDTLGYVCEVAPDLCPRDPDKVQPGRCGCGLEETDTDGDGTPDCVDLCAEDPHNVSPGPCGCAAEPSLSPAGTACSSDVLCGQPATCDGAGVCGRRQLTITIHNPFGPALDDYQVRVDVGSDHADFWRVTRKQGPNIRIAENGEQAAYWIEMLDVRNRRARIWVKVGHIDAGAQGKELQLHYGDGQSGDQSDLDATFLLADEFAGTNIDTDKWTVVDDAGFNVRDGLLVGTDTSGRLHSQMSFDNATQPVVVEARFRVGALPLDGYMALGLRDPASTSGFGLMPHPTAPAYFIRNGAGWSGPFTYGGNYIADWTRASVRLDAPGADNARIGLERHADGAAREMRTYTRDVAGQVLMLGQRYDDSSTTQPYEAAWDWVFVRKAADPEPFVGVQDADADGNTDCDDSCPMSCATAPANCGSIDDGCGTTINCGSCSGTDVCSANVCEPST